MNTKMQGKENATKPVEKESVDGEVNDTSNQRKSRQYAQILDGFHTIDVTSGRNTFARQTAVGCGS